jgi:protein-disulfide isomerase
VTLNRRETLVLAASASLAAYYGLTPAQAQEGTTKDVAALANVAVPDHPIGSASAPVTVIEYASPTCPHCATFHNAVYPEFKTQYIDTGKVQFLVRPFVRNVLDAVVFLLAETAGEEQFHNVIETYFKTQGQWATSNTPRDAILEIAKQLGFTEQSFDEALKNQDLFDAMETMREQALEEFGLEGTPTFYINGKQLTGDKTIAEMAEAIDPLIPADFQPTDPMASEPMAEEPAMDAPAMDGPAMDAETPASN